MAMQFSIDRQAGTHLAQGLTTVGSDHYGSLQPGFSYNIPHGNQLNLRNASLEVQAFREGS